MWKQVDADAIARLRPFDSPLLFYSGLSK